MVYLHSSIGPGSGKILVLIQQHVQKYRFLMLPGFDAWRIQRQRFKSVLAQIYNQLEFASRHRVKLFFIEDDSQVH